MTFFGLGFSVGPLGNAMTGGFFVPSITAMALGLHGIAAQDQLLAVGVRRAGRLLSAASALNVVGWAPVLLPLTLGSQGASPRFVIAVMASAVCSIGMSIIDIPAPSGRNPPGSSDGPEHAQECTARASSSLNGSVGRFPSGHVWYRCPASNTQVEKIHNESANGVLNARDSRRQVGLQPIGIIQRCGGLDRPELVILAKSHQLRRFSRCSILDAGHDRQ
jgi:hypothetical protein